ncbi:TPA: hypothetical protein DCX16_04445 [bacterium]|nr:hypothetical protein [bacterium]
MIEEHQVQSERRIKELEALYEIGKAITSELELQKVLKLILKKALEVTKSDYGTLGMLYDDKLIYEVIIPEGVETPSQRIGEGITGKVAEKKKPILVDDVTKDPVYIEVFHNMKSELAVPMMFQDELIGVLNVESPIISAFDKNDQRLLEALADQAAIAIQNAKQYQKLEDTKEQLAAANALAWLGIVGAIWKHDVIQKAYAIKMDVDTLKLDVTEKAILEMLNRIDRGAELIMKVAPDLPPEDVEELVSINDILDTAVKRCNLSKDIKFHFQRLPDGLTPIIASNAWLMVAFEYIITNALRAMSGKGELAIVCRKETDRVLIEISDTGCGIPEDIKSQLFKKQVSGAEGRGVGLLLTKTILLRYGGNIELKSTGPKGTTFTLWLPIKRSTR